MKRVQAVAGEVLVHRADDVQVVIAPRVLALAVAALVYGISSDTLVRLQDREGFPVVRVGSRRLVPVAAADEWFAARVEQGAA
jgi:hypothetical protein